MGNVEVLDIILRGCQWGLVANRVGKGSPGIKRSGIGSVRSRGTSVGSTGGGKGKGNNIIGGIGRGIASGSVACNC